MSARAWADRLGQGALDLLFPPVCVACRAAIDPAARDRVVCGVCWARCLPLPAPRCDRCWSPLPAGAGEARSCAVCRGLPPFVRSVRSAFRMVGPVRKMVHALKYGGWEVAALPLAERLAALPLPEDTVEEARLVLPVPTTPARLRERGFNQAERLASAYAARTGRSVAAGALLRPRASGTQTALHPDERRANVAGAFAVPPTAVARLEGEHLLLVDDVWTTGATATACAEALCRAGARTVSVVTFARALPELERAAALV